MMTIGINAAQQQLISQDPLQINFVSRNLTFVVTTGNPGPDEYSIEAQVLHRFKSKSAASGRINNQVGLAGLLNEFIPRSFSCADISGFQTAHNLTLKIRSFTASERIHLKATQFQHQRGQQTNLACSQNVGHAGTPNLHPLLRLVSLMHCLGGATHRLHQHMQMLEP